MRYVLVILFLVSRVWANQCTGLDEGAACQLIDGTPGSCVRETCQRIYSTYPVGDAITGAGTIAATSGQETVTGTSTSFLTDVRVGDLLTANGQSFLIREVTDATHLKITSGTGGQTGFTPAVSAGTTYTYTRPINLFLDAAGGLIGIVDARGRFNSGSTFNNARIAAVGVPAQACSTTTCNRPELGAAVFGGIGATSSFTGGTAGVGGGNILWGGQGGDSSSTTGTAGSGGDTEQFGGDGGSSTAASGGTSGAGGDVVNQAGNAGVAVHTSGVGGHGGAVLALGGTGGDASGTNGFGGPVELVGGPAGNGSGTPALGGLVTMTGGNGSSVSTNGATGGAGGSASVAGGTGGLGTLAGTTTGGIGGATTVSGGLGGDGQSVNGAGGAVTIAGGAAGAGAGSAGAVGDVNIQPTAGVTKFAGGKFTVDANGNITKIRNVTTSFPSSNVSGVQKQDGSGNYASIPDAAGVLVNNGSGTFAWRPGLQSNGFTSGTTVASVCTTETQVTSWTVTGNTSYRFDHALTVRINNAASGARDFTMRLRRGGTACSDATDVDANAYGKTTVAGTSFGGLTVRYDEAVPGSSTTYRVCACTSSATGTQTFEYARLVSVQY